MRGFLFSIVILTSMSISYAQSLRLVNTSNKVFGRVGSEIEGPVAIKNVSSKPVEITFQRTNNNISSGQESFFCLGRTCYSPETNTSPETKTLRPGEIYDGFKGVLRSGMGKSNSQISYCFINVADPKDKLCTTLNFQIESSGGNDVLFFNEDINISNIYPNPINEVALFDYSIKSSTIKSKIILHNVLGSIVGEYSLNEFENKLKIYTQSFKPGVYFYTLSIDNQNLITKKFVIKR